MRRSPTDCVRRLWRDPILLHHRRDRRGPAGSPHLHSSRRCIRRLRKARVRDPLFFVRAHANLCELAVAPWRTAVPSRSSKSPARPCQRRFLPCPKPPRFRPAPPLARPPTRPPPRARSDEAPLRRLLRLHLHPPRRAGCTPTRSRPRKRKPRPRQPWTSTWPRRPRRARAGVARRARTEAQRRPLPRRLRTRSWRDWACRLGRGMLRLSRGARARRGSSSSSSHRDWRRGWEGFRVSNSRAGRAGRAAEQGEPRRRETRCLRGSLRCFFGSGRAMKGP